MIGDEFRTRPFFFDILFLIFCIKSRISFHGGDNDKALIISGIFIVRNRSRKCLDNY